jgi:hypothetical protein
MLVSAVASDTTARVLSELKLNLVFSGAATGSGWLFFVAILFLRLIDQAKSTTKACANPVNCMDVCFTFVGRRFQPRLRLRT